MQNERIKVQGGKLYTKVVDRLTAFKGRFPTAPDGVLIHTQIHTLTDNYVVFKAFILEGETVLATGHGFNAIAKEKAFEKAETVAVGRALAFFDPMYGGESELASQEEMEKFKELTSDNTITKDDGSHVPPTETKSNGVLDLAEEAKKKMTNGTSPATSDGVCNFTKHKGKMWSVVAKEDLDYITWILNNVKDLDSDTGKLLNQFV
jgi:hypothetical protein